jgi:subtilisin family serine protease
MHTQQKHVMFGKRAQRTVTLGLLAAVSLASINMVAHSEPGTKQKPQTAQKFNLSRLTAQDREDLILVMPNPSADKDELAEVLQENHGVVVGQMGKGRMTVLIVKVDRGQAAKVEKKLQADKKNFSTVNANHRESSCAFVPKDPGYSAVGAWHFDRLNLPEAWELRSKNHKHRLQGLVVMDSGVDGRDVNRSSQGTNVTGEYKKIGLQLIARTFGILGKDVADLKDFIVQKGNLANTMTYDFTDQNGHGTWVASAAAGSTNDIGSVGVNPAIQILPIKIADGPYNTTITTDDLNVVSAMMCAFDMADAPVNNVRIVNISYANMFDEKKHPILIEMFKYWYYNKDGLVFVSAGNDGKLLTAKDKPFVNVVSAMGHVKGMELVDAKGTNPWKSAFGPCVHFTAPGEDIQVTDINGMPTSVGGTSFSSPIVAGVASLILSVRPDLKNTQVEDIMRRSAVNTTGGRNAKFGWGMPDAAKAIKLALSI